MSNQRRFTKEFESEAVRLAETSGRTLAARSRRISGLGFRRWCAGSAGAGIYRLIIRPLAGRKIWQPS